MPKDFNVVAVGDDFIVCWARDHSVQWIEGTEEAYTYPMNKFKGRVECALLERNSDGTFTRHQESVTSGEQTGYLVDEGLGVQSAAIMVDVATTSAVGRGAVVAYNDGKDWASKEGLRARTANLKSALVDFSGRTTPSVKTPQTIVRGIGTSDTGDNQAPTGGGYVICQIEEDKDGKIVLTYDEFKREGQDGCPEDRSFIHIKRFSVSSAGVFTLIDSIRHNRTGAQISNRLRRTALSVTTTDKHSSAAVTWSDSDIDVTDTTVEWVRADFSNSGAGGGYSVAPLFIDLGGGTLGYPGFGSTKRSGWPACIHDQYKDFIMWGEGIGADTATLEYAYRGATKTQITTSTYTGTTVKRVQRPFLIGWHEGGNGYILVIYEILDDATAGDYKRIVMHNVLSYALT